MFTPVRPQLGTISRLFLVALGSGLPLLVTACAGSRSGRLMLPPPTDRWTREIAVYDALDLRMHGYVSFQSLDLQLSNLRQREAAYRLSAAQVAEERTALESDWGAFAEFRLSAFTPKRGWNDFGQTGSHWKIYLVDGSGLLVEPSSVQIERIPDSVESPRTAKWNRMYRIRFDRPAGTDAKPMSDDRLLADYHLLITGPLGRAEVRW